MKTARPLRFLITAGPTREFLDPIRYISNRSSGKMGYAVAEAARKISAHVVLVSGPTALTPPTGVDCVAVTTAAEMAREVFRRYGRCDVVIMTAAVCDFRPSRMARQKIKKTALHGKLTVTLETTTDILAELGRRKKKQFLVGFAAETTAVETYAAGKLRRKNLDLIVANDLRAFEGDQTVVTFIHRDGRVERMPQQTKRRVAREILKRVLVLAG